MNKKEFGYLVKYMQQTLPLHYVRFFHYQNSRFLTIANKAFLGTYVPNHRPIEQV